MTDYKHTVDFDEMDSRKLDRIKSSFYFVEATGFEKHSFWRNFAKQSPIKDQELSKSWVDWEQEYVGHTFQIARFAGFPITITLFWGVLDGRRVCFYESESLVVHHGIVDSFIEDCRKLAGSVPRTDAFNFGHCISDIKRSNEEDRCQKN